MKRQLAAILGTTSLIGAAISLAGSAGAVVPEGCQGGWTPFGGGRLLRRHDLRRRKLRPLRARDSPWLRRHAVRPRVPP